MKRLFHHSASKQSRGFTLIEMMVVLAILGLIVGLYIPNLQRQQIRTRLISARNEIRAELEKVATWSTAVKRGTDIAGDAYNFQLVGYGVRFQTNTATYTLWEVWADELGRVATFDTTATARKSVKTLSANISLSSIAPVQPTSGKLDLVFTTPTGYIDESFTKLDSEGKVVINLTSKSFSESLTIWRNGRAS